MASIHPGLRIALSCLLWPEVWCEARDKLQDALCQEDFVCQVWRRLLGATMQLQLLCSGCLRCGNDKKAFTIVYVENSCEEQSLTFISNGAWTPPAMRPYRFVALVFSL